MTGLLDFVFLGVFVVLALIGFRIGVLRMLLGVSTVFLVYLSIVSLGADALRLVRDNFSALDSFGDGVISFVIYVIFASVIFVTLFLVTKVLRKLMSALLLGWVDRIGGAFVGVLATFITIIFVSVWGAWVLNNSSLVIVAIEAAVLVNLVPTEVADFVNDINSWLDAQINSSVVVSNIGWWSWDFLRSFLIPDQFFGISSEMFDSAIEALRESSNSQ